jgi:hypothetical protein
MANYGTIERRRTGRAAWAVVLGSLSLVGTWVGSCTGQDGPATAPPGAAKPQASEKDAGASRAPRTGPGGPNAGAPGPGPFGFGPPGFGPPGFGGPGAMQTSFSMLLGMVEIKKELQLSGDQTKQVEELMRRLQDQMRASFESLDFQEMSTLRQSEREQRLAALGKKMEEANTQADEKIAKILEPKQAARLNQLRLQREGLTAFGRPEIAKQLGLTADQQAKIKKIQEASAAQARGWFGGPGQSDDPRDPFTRMRQEREKTQADLLAVLTSEQKAKWANMKGKAFEFPQPTWGGPGGFGPGGLGPGGAGSLESVKVQIRASDEEWKVIGPKLRKVVAARQAAETGLSTGESSNTGGPRGGFGGAPPDARGPGPAARGGPDRPPGGGPFGFAGRDSAIALALADLQAATANPKTPPDELQKKVAAVRLARQKARDRLEAAKKELLELLAPDQEAVLVGLGYLD